MGIAVTREVYGGVLRAKPIKHPHPYPLSRQIPMNLKFGSMGIAVTREVYGGVLRAKPIKHPHPYPLSRQIPMNLKFSTR
jgi:hypothetical protein